MSYDMPVDDPALLYPEFLPQPLKAPLRMSGAVTRAEIGHAIAEQLGYPTKYLRDASYRFFWNLVPGLAMAVQAGEQWTELRAPEIADTAVRTVAEWDLAIVLDQIGCGKQKVNCRVYEIPDTLRKVLSDNVTGAVLRLLMRWNHTGTLGTDYTSGHSRDLDRLHG